MLSAVFIMYSRIELINSHLCIFWDDDPCVPLADVLMIIDLVSDATDPTRPFALPALFFRKIAMPLFPKEAAHNYSDGTS